MPKRVCQCARMLKSIRLFFQQKSQIDPVDTSTAVFVPLLKCFRRYFSLVSENDEMSYNFFKKVNFLPRVLRTHRIQFWQPCANFFDKKLKKFAQKTKMKENDIFSKKNSIKYSSGHVDYNQKILWQKKFFFKKFSSKYIYRDVKCSFLKPAEKNLPESRFFSGQSPKRSENS